MLSEPAPSLRGVCTGDQRISANENCRDAGLAIQQLLIIKCHCSNGAETSYSVLMERFAAAVEEDYADTDFLVRSSVP